MPKPPCSVYEQTSGLAYFPRMLDKIRLHAAGELPSDYQKNLGRGADNWCVEFLRVSYEALRERTFAGGTDEEILEWCYTQGRRCNETDLLVWNAFATKLGWNDMASPILARYKAASGMAKRDDLQTMAEYFEVDEGRKP